MDQKPSIGRIVLFRQAGIDFDGGEWAPAIVTRVWSDELVNLVVITPDGVLRQTSVPRASSSFAQSIAWKWPERV